MKVKIFFLVLVAAFLLIKAVSGIHANIEKGKAASEIQSSHTLSADKTNDEALKEILTELNWSAVGDLYFGSYEMHASGYTKDIKALEKYAGRIKYLHDLPDKVYIDFYFRYTPNLNQVEAFTAYIDGANIAHDNDGWSHISPVNIYHDLHDSRKNS